MEYSAEQQKIIDCDTDNIMIIAGPGTGKTYQLGKRIKYLVEEKGTSPEEITVITFTAAAAKNMRNRISDETRMELFVDPSLQPKSIRTMHSLGYAKDFSFYINFYKGLLTAQNHGPLVRRRGRSSSITALPVWVHKYRTISAISSGAIRSSL